MPRSPRSRGPLTHMFEEENAWFPALHEKAEHPARITARYMEEYTRYTGDA